MNSVIEWLAENLWGTAVVGIAISAMLIGLILFGVWLDDWRRRKP